MVIMKTEGYWTCFACGGKRRYDNGKPVGLRVLELRKVKKFGKKQGQPGKVIAKATVCELCYADGHTTFPTIGFKGYVKYRQMPGDLEKVIAQAKKKWGDKVEIPEQGSTPSYPQSASTVPSVPSENEYKQSEK